MWHVYEAEQEVRLRQVERRREAEQECLARKARAAGASRRGPGVRGRRARLRHRLGGLLVAWGSRLQEQTRPRMEAPSLERAW